MRLKILFGICFTLGAACADQRSDQTCEADSCDQKGESVQSGLYVLAPDAEHIRSLEVNAMADGVDVAFQVPEKNRLGESVPLFGQVSPRDGKARLESDGCLLDLVFRPGAIRVVQQTDCDYDTKVFEGEYRTIAGTYKVSADDKSGRLRISESEPAVISVDLEIAGETGATGEISAGDVMAASGFAVINDKGPTPESSCDLFLFFLSDGIDLKQKGVSCPSAGGFLSFEGLYARVGAAK